MSDNAQYILHLKDFDRNIRSGWTSSQNDGDFYDVTLVSDEDQIKAHKIVLSTCSPVLRHILKKNPHQHPLIYLLGIKFSHLVNLINFMYQGEIKIPQDEINDFLKLGRDLKVVGLSENEEDEVNEKSCTIDSQSILQNLKNMLTELPVENTITEVGLENLSFSCDKCPFTATQKESLMHHIEVHDKSTLLKSKKDKILDTNTVFTKKNNILHPSSRKNDTKKNIVNIIEDDDEMEYASLETVDKKVNEFNEDSKANIGSKRNKLESSIKKEGVNKKFLYEQQNISEPNLNYSYPERNYNDIEDIQENITKTELSAYNNSNIEKVNLNEPEQNIYRCEQCNVKFKQPSSLDRHIKSIHERIRYSCEKCTFTATQSASLKRHVQSIHDKIRHFCSLCDYSCTQKSQLNVHLKVKH